MRVVATRGAPLAEGLSLNDAASWCRARQAVRERVVLTNGCFDLVHIGHVRHLAAARRLGERLVVAVNNDCSVRALKGPGRPLLPLTERIELLCALRPVDLVVPFAEGTAVEVLRALRPDVYVKGGNYDPYSNRPAEASVALALGMVVVYLPRVADWSTSRLIQRIRQVPC